MAKVAYSIAGAAKATSVSEQTIVLAIRAGALSARRVNDDPVVLKIDLEEWAQTLPTYTLTSAV